MNTTPSEARKAAPLSSGEKWLVGIFSLLALLVHLLTNGRYGYFRDELYFIACSHHLATGYVDMAPLSAWVLRLELALFGDSLLALRLFPAIAGALTVALTGAIARQLGGRAWAIALACIAAAAAPIYLALGNFYSLNVFEPLFWMGCVLVLIRILNADAEARGARLWLWFGLLAGLGVENKHSFAFFGVGLTIGLLLTPARRHFARPWIWLGGLVAFALALPNLLWQVQHHWATFELLRNVARSNKNVVLGPLAFIAQQVLLVNPAALPLWLGGLCWLLRSRRYRALGLAYLLTLAEFIILHGKVYYLAPIYPMLFAAGGILFERLFAQRWRWLKPALAIAIIALCALVAPTVLPILAPKKLVTYMEAIHFRPPRTETSHNAALPQLFADQFGWKEMVRSVAQAYHRLTPNEHRMAGIFCQDYGQAGAIDFFGPQYGLPPAISGHQNYYLWGPRGDSGRLLLVLDAPGGDEPKQFRTVEDLGPIETSPWAMPWERRQHIYLCRDLKIPLRDAWPQVKNWL
ncbi:MAG: glycosyltransferase family 39 protein [Rhodanobacteraceae bacterium]